MTAPAWPTALSGKALAVSGYQEDVLIDPSVRTNMDSGPPKARARFTTVPKKIEGVIDTLSSAQVDTLLSFWETTCAMGTLRFTWLHPRTGASGTFMWMKYPAVTPSNNSPIVFTAAISLLYLP